MPAFYIPVLVMLLGLILRGVAFEFRGKASRTRWVWDVSFAAGSFAASFMQGAMVGALVQGLQFANGGYIGGTFGWLTFFAVLDWTLFQLRPAWCLWLVRKSDGPVSRCRAASNPAARYSWWSSLVHPLAEHLPILQRWIDRPYLFLFPLVGAGATAVFAKSILRHDDDWPFNMVVLIFVLAFGAFALSFWPYMIPFVVTIEQAAAPLSSLAFMFWGEGCSYFR